MKKFICAKLCVVFFVNVFVMPLVYAGKKHTYFQKKAGKVGYCDKQYLKNKKATRLRPREQKIRNNNKAKKEELNFVRSKYRGLLKNSGLLRIIVGLSLPVSGLSSLYAYSSNTYDYIDPEHGTRYSFTISTKGGTAVIYTPLGPVRIKLSFVRTPTLKLGIKKIDSCVHKLTSTPAEIKAHKGIYYIKSCEVKLIDIDTNGLLLKHTISRDPDYCLSKVNAYNCIDGARVCDLGTCLQCFEHYGFKPTSKKIWEGEGIESGICLGYVNSTAITDVAQKITQTISSQSNVLFWQIILIILLAGGVAKAVTLPFEIGCFINLYCKYWNKKNSDHVYVVKKNYKKRGKKKSGSGGKKKKRTIVIQESSSDSGESSPSNASVSEHSNQKNSSNSSNSSDFEDVIVDLKRCNEFGEL